MNVNSSIHPGSNPNMYDNAWDTFFNPCMGLGYTKALVKGNIH